MELLENYLKSRNIADYKRKLRLFDTYYDLLIVWNKKFNLTAITQRDDAEIKHFIDSILPFDLIAPNASVCDIGSGAGFPGLPLAIIRPDCHFTLVDSLNKRVGFLNHVITQLELDNCVALHARAEDFAKNSRQSFDCCVARAVASLPTLLEYTLPVLKINGNMLAYKSVGYKDELQLAKNALSVLGGTVGDIIDQQLPNGDNRVVISIKKTTVTPPIYPRGGNKPRLQPL